MEAGELIHDRYCSIHPKFIADTWDKDCCILTCVKCRRTDHAEHKVVYGDESDCNERKEVECILEDVKSIINKQNAYLAAVEQDLSSLNQTLSRLPDKISHTFHFLKTLIDQREKEMQIELQQHRDKVLEDLRKKKNTSESSLQRCGTTFGYINKTLQYGSILDVLEIKQVLEEKSQDCSRSVPPEDYKPLPLPGFNTERLEKIRSVLTQFGNIATEIDQTEDKETKSEEELTQELQKMTELKLSQKKKDLKEVTHLKSTLDKVISQEQDAERFSGLYRLRTPGVEESFLLICTNIKFDKTKYNAEWVCINDDGELINRPQPYPSFSDERLQKYRGTRSTAPFPQCGSAQYFEVEARVGIEKPLIETNLLLEIGLAREKEHDESHWIGGQPHSYSLNISHCPIRSSICRKIRRHGSYISCLPDALENTPATSTTLHVGVVYDSARRLIAFIDVRETRIIGKIDNVDSSVALWPMFGVYYPSSGQIGMSLVVGNDIDMTDRKKTLILDCFS